MSAGWDPAKYDERFAEDGSLETMFTEVYVPHRGVGLWCRTGRSRSRRATASAEKDSNASGMRIPGGPGVVGRPDGTVQAAVAGAGIRIPEPERETGAILPALALTSGMYQPA
jgi:hypothetical protein